jgi:hypothetical protein
MEKTMRRARSMVCAAFLFPVVVIAAIAADLHLRAWRQDRSAVQWMQALDLSSPALWPAGTFQRHCEALPTGVDIRMSPVFDWDRDGRLQMLPRRQGR